ncbi:MULTISPECIES: tetratricopeptide repeat protein [unclassified Mesorhizobium]|uniref:tetratricopeptide repeat protein n=1 Tax=unclassified Mesorhizobium TaxID=325217 RepID=UPI000FE2F9F7|nr:MULTISPECIES: tetratricopeptide repeat protein [unclassified Mesorhizobium]MDG4893713.1 tetratricopeptide repeat protein [Mesorhizobium sp. WSM4976]RWH70163.1 MAG: tetratricopeptide repeat protein [Mesorhizobium sp.]RWL26451.1 MAG: tetratricopeptide repeat protein [Mesorhizobium sp.]RWL28561.1 MAG: tetratricopeptide repeat protein [Mesorhizobium sp.]RWL37502.1 MAG: tetratricopeptide repeat protein [Mesorhizobium sp.]
MSDDSFIREVNEEIRREQAQALWDRFGPAILGIAILIVLATAAVVGYRYWDETRANRSGDAFSAALKLANDGKNDEAIAALDQLEKDGYGAYPLLARMRAATVKADKGDVDGAVKDFDAVAADGAIPAGIRDMARLRAALLLVDHGSFADVSSRVEALTADTNPLRHSAREALGLAAWKDGKSADALKLFDQISSDDGAPRNVRQRAQLMSELIRGSGNAS